MLDTYQLRQKYFVVDMGRIPPEVLENVNNAVSSLVWLERGKTPEAIRTAIAELEKAVRAPEYARLRRAFTTWINRIVLRKLQISDPIPEFDDLQEVDTMLAETVTQWTEQWKMEGLQAGLQKGRQEGILLGEARGLCVAVIECLEERFTVVPVPLVAKLGIIQDTDILHKLLVATLKVDSLDAFDAIADKAIGMTHQ